MSVSIHTYALPVFWLDSSNAAVSLPQIANGGFLAAIFMIGGPELAACCPRRADEYFDYSLGMFAGKFRCLRMRWHVGQV